MTDAEQALDRFPISSHRMFFREDAKIVKAIRMPILKFSPYANGRKSLK